MKVDVLYGVGKYGLYGVFLVRSVFVCRVSMFVGVVRVGFV